MPIVEPKTTINGNQKLPIVNNDTIDKSVNNNANILKILAMFFSPIRHKVRPGLLFEIPYSSILSIRF